MELEKEENIEEQESERRVYELGYLLVPLIAEEEVGEHITALKNILESSSAVVISEEWPKMTALLYGMKHKTALGKKNFDHAYFGWILFEVEKKAIKEIEEAVKKNENVIRSILVKSSKDAPMKKTTRRTEPLQKKRKEISPKKEEISEEEVDAAIEELVVE